jgi:signal transduction histidine kinase
MEGVFQNKAEDSGTIVSGMVYTLLLIWSEKLWPAYPITVVVMGGNQIINLADDTALLRRNGSELIIEDSAAPITDTEGRVSGVVLVFRDITEKSRKAQERSKTLSELQVEKVVREKFIDTLTHDLRNPLTTIKMGAQLLQRTESLDRQIYFFFH